MPYEKEITNNTIIATNKQTKEQHPHNSNSISDYYDDKSNNNNNNNVLRVIENKLSITESLKFFLH